MDNPLYRHKTTGGLVRVTAAYADKVFYAPVDFSHHESSLPAAAFHAQYEPYIPNLLRGSVTADFLDHTGCAPYADWPRLDCVSHPHLTWNGWAVPYFEREHIGPLAELLERAGLGRLHYENGELFHVSDTHTIIPPEQFTLPNGSTITAWGVGARSWCWQTFLPDAELVSMARALTPRQRALLADTLKGLL